MALRFEYGEIPSGVESGGETLYGTISTDRALAFAVTTRQNHFSVLLRSPVEAEIKIGDALERVIQLHGGEE